MSQSQKKSFSIFSIISVLIGIWLIIYVLIPFLKPSWKINTSVEGKMVVTTTIPANLGDIPIKGGKVATKFSFQNTGKGNLTILKGQTSCMCTVANISKVGSSISPTITMPMGQGSSGTRLDITLAPGETAELIAVFDPMAHGPDAVGPIKRDVILTTDSTETPEIRFSFLGNVVR